MLLHSAPMRIYWAITYRIAIYHNSMYICPMYSKELLKGTLSAIILNMLAERGRMYGYEIFLQAKEQSDGKILLKDGSLYPALQKMSKEGLVEYEIEYVGKRIRKYYKITAEGKKKKVMYLEELKDFMNTLNKLLSPQFNIA